MARGVLLTLACLLLAADPAAAGRYGAPDVVRVARTSDLRAHTAERREQWILSLVGPRAGQYAGIAFGRTPDSTSIGFGPGYSSDGHSVAAGRLEYSAARPVAFTGGGSGAIEPQRRTTRVTAQTADGAADVTVSRIRPGPTAMRWQLGEYPAGTPVRFSEAFPIGTGVARGTIVVRGRSLEVSGWRAALEHNWGNFDPSPPQDILWNNWDTWLVHGAHAAAWLATGINRRDYMTGPGATDATWAGVLAVIGRRTVVCRPAVHRRNWLIAVDLDPFRLGARQMSARCGGRNITFRRGTAGSDFQFDANAGRRTIGWGRHVASEYP